MSEWFYINLAYGLTWVTLAGYGAYLARRAVAARGALRSVETQPGGER